MGHRAFGATNDMTDDTRKNTSKGGGGQAKSERLNPQIAQITQMKKRSLARNGKGNDRPNG